MHVGQGAHRLEASARGEPGPSQRPLPLHQLAVGGQQGDGGPKTVHLLLRDSQEVGLCDVVVEDDQDDGRRAVVVDGPVGRVVAQVWGESRRHGDRPHRPPLPLQEEGPCGLPAPEHPEGVGVHRAPPAEVAEVAGRPSGRVELVDLPAQVAGLAGEGRREAVDGGGVLHVAEELPAAPAPDAAPACCGPGVGGSGAPPLLGSAHGGPVPAGQQGQPRVGEHQPPLGGGYAGGQPETLKGRRELGGPLIGDAQQPGQVAQGEPGPVGEQVEGALLGGLQEGGQHVFGDAPLAPPLVDVLGHGDPRQGPLGGERAPAFDPVDGVSEADGGVDRGQPPHRVVGGRCRRLPLQG